MFHLAVAGIAITWNNRMARFQGVSMDRIEGINVDLRLVEPDDASFLLTLRTDEKRGKYLSKVDNDLAKQKQWIENYKVREIAGEEYYFIIESKQGDPLGCVRVYGFVDVSFSWGSWILKQGAPRTAAIESAIRVYEFAFYKLGLSQCYFEVRKGNKSVKRFHERFGAKVVREDEEQYFFVFDIDTYQSAKPRYMSFIE